MTIEEIIEQQKEMEKLRNELFKAFVELASKDLDRMIKKDLKSENNS